MTFEGQTIRVYLGQPIEPLPDTETCDLSAIQVGPSWGDLIEASVFEGPAIDLLDAIDEDGQPTVDIERGSWDAETQQVLGNA